MAFFVQPENRRDISYAASALVLVISCAALFFSSANPGERVKVDSFTIKTPGGYSAEYSGGHLPSVAETGKDGRFDFSATVDLPQRLEQKPLALVMGPAFYPVQISLNGRALFYQGAPGEKAVSYVLNSAVIPLDKDEFANSKRLRLDISVHAGAERHPLPELYIDSYSAAVESVFRRNFVTTGIVQAGYVVALILAVYFLSMFFYHGKALFLYTACAALLYSLSIVVIVFNYPSNAFVLLEKISRVAFPLCVLALFLFFSELTGVFRSKKIRVANALCALPFIVRTLFAADRFAVSMRFNESMLLYMMPNLLLIFLMILISAIRDKLRHNKLTYGAFILTLFASIHDIAYVLADQTPYAYITNIGYLVMVVSIFLNLSREHSSVFRALQASKREVELLNTTLQKKVEEGRERLKDMSLRDPLTGLRNRSFISAYVIELVESFRLSMMLSLESDSASGLQLQEKVIGLLLLDIDHFRKTNDTYGHNAGDAVLVAVADALRRMTRADDIVVRWGGEEFLVILNRTDPDFIPLFSKKLLEMFRALNVAINRELTLNPRCSIGGVIFPFCDELPQLLSFDKCISLCNEGLTHAKKSGRDRAAVLTFNREYVRNEKLVMELNNFQKDMDLANPIVVTTLIE